MRSNYLENLKTAVLAVTVLLLGASLSFAQQQINLTAGPSTITLPDGTTVPMWGYSCGAAVSGSAASCARLKPGTAGWSPVVITIPTTASGGLSINLQNSLPSPVPTSIVIVGQLGGGLGVLSQRTTTASPDHPTQTLTWPASSNNPDDGSNTPPAQGRRVQSFSTEVANGATTLLPAWGSLRPGTYLIESGTHPSIQGPMGLYGILVVTTAPVGATAGQAYPAQGTVPAVAYNAEIPLLLSEIDPVQNVAVSTAVNTAGFDELRVWSGQTGQCGDPAVHTCYPPAVNYTPLYYLINGVAFDKTNAAASLFPTAPASGVTGSVLVRMVNAGLRMHVPSIVGAQTGASAAGFSLIAEDGNVLPGVPRVQSEVFMAAGKTYDVMVNGPAAGTTATTLPIYDRALGLSGNAVTRDSGMLAYIGVNGGLAPSASGLGAAMAVDDTYNAVISCTADPCKPLAVSDPSKGLISNDTNVSGVHVLVGPTGGTLTLNANGTFSYVQNVGTSDDSFTYCANGSVTGTTCSSGVSAKVTLGAATIEGASGIVCTAPTFTSPIATTLSIKPPGVLAFCKDGAGYPLTIGSSSTGSNATVSVDENGGFNATTNTHAGSVSASFTFQAKNSQGTLGTQTTVNLVFPAPGGVQVSLVDGKTKETLPADYRWIIEEDRTFFVDPNCQTNPLPSGCPSVTTDPCDQRTPAIFGTNFHTAYMPVVAQGCVGTTSCESGQSMLGASAVCDVGNGACRPGDTKTAVDPSQVVLDPTKHYYISVLPGRCDGPRTCHGRRADRPWADNGNRHRRA